MEKSHTSKSTTGHPSLNKSGLSDQKLNRKHSKSGDNSKRHKDHSRDSVPGPDSEEKKAREKAKVDKINTHIEETIIEMSNTVDRAVQRGERLEDIEKASYQMQEEAKMFSSNTSRARRNLWWKSKRTTILIVVVVLVILIVVTIILILRFMPMRII
jgi:hypothetical protein